MVGVVAHYWNGNLIFKTPKHLDRLLQAAVQASKRPIKGLLGPTWQVEKALEGLALDDRQLQLNAKEKLYRLRLADLIVPDALSAGEVLGRRVEQGDLELVIAWRVAYSIETLGEQTQLRQQVRASIERSFRKRQTWLLEAEGKPVASTSFNTTIAEAVQVGGVWTPPELRRRGYARAAVAASLLDARADGAELAILFTPEHNIPAQKAYLALGSLSYRGLSYCSAARGW